MLNYLTSVSMSLIQAKLAISWGKNTSLVSKVERHSAKLFISEESCI